MSCSSACATKLGYGMMSGCALYRFICSSRWPLDRCHYGCCSSDHCCFAAVAQTYPFDRCPVKASISVAPIPKP